MVQQDENSLSDMSKVDRAARVLGRRGGIGMSKGVATRV